MNEELSSIIRQLLRDNGLGNLKSVRPVSGGSINASYQLLTDNGRYFLKVNSSTRFPTIFEAEKRGLKLLSHSKFTVPEVITTAVIQSKQFILMQWIEGGEQNTNFWNIFGEYLAGLHLQTSSAFGLNHNNYIGSLPQKNDERKSWAEFYRDQRLIPQIKLAEQNNQLTRKMNLGFQSLFHRLGDIFPIEKPALLHGDLWSGNLMVTSKGSPCIFDPAVYYGHREMDLAMMALFGGFGSGWIDAYNNVYPLDNGWRERIEIGQLYPLMVHVNLFGGTYARSVESVLQKFV